MATTTETTEQGSGFTGNRQKVAAHLTQNEALIFEKSSPGKNGYQLPPLDVPEVDAASAARRRRAREDLADCPKLSEIEIIRHFTRLSTWNYAIDLGMYPLGSCTMKYNPRVNEFVARLEGIAEAHPYQPESLSQGALRIMQHARRAACIEITGMDAITLQPAAGAHGEFTGILLDPRLSRVARAIRASKILIPDSAHGTNPATAAICGYQVENLQVERRRAWSISPQLDAAGRRRHRRADAHQSHPPSASSRARSTRSPTSCTPRARCSTWMAPT